MFTSRTRLVLAIASIALVASLRFRQEGTALASLAIVIWIGLEWISFRRRVLVAGAALKMCERTIDGVARGTVTLIVNQQQDVRGSATVSRKLAGLRLWIEDVVPVACQLDSPALVVDASWSQQIRWHYAIRPNTIGRFVLPGIQVKITDTHGFFQQQCFIPLRQEVTVLPFMIRPQRTVSVLKQKNAQLLSGHHQHRQPGVSGELLGIRDYQAGDPPRTIAWKASARVGRLLTCEYESEVPIRATVLCDLSDYQFFGRPRPAAADRIVSVTASIARLLLSDRDPVACILVRESNRARVPHGFGERQLTRLLHTLLSYCGSQSISEDLPLDDLIAVTWTNCFHQVPELFDERINPASRLLQFGKNQRLVGQRRQLSYALTQLYRREPGYPQRIQQDERAFRNLCRKFLTDHPISVGPSPAIPNFDSLRRAHRRATETMCRGLLEGVARAKDNELFVMVGTLPLDGRELDVLENAVRVARAAYHRVVVVDVGVEPFGRIETDPTAMRILDETRRRNALEQTRQTAKRLSRLEVKVGQMDNASYTEQVVSEVELLRSGRARSRVASQRV